MSFEFWDGLRILCVALTGFSYALDFSIIVISFTVLRPKRKIGFAFWHIVAISIIQYFVTAACIDLFANFNRHPTWRLYGFLPSIVIYNIGLLIILRVEIDRYKIKKRAREIAGDELLT